MLVVVTALVDRTMCAHVSLGGIQGLRIVPCEVALRVLPGQIKLTLLIALIWIPNAPMRVYATGPLVCVNALKVSLVPLVREQGVPETVAGMETVLP